jgi:hypothetical protein
MFHIFVILRLAHHRLRGQMLFVRFKSTGDPYSCPSSGMQQLYLQAVPPQCERLN